MEFSRPEYWSGWPICSPAELPDPGIKPVSPELQADSLPAEPPGTPVLCAAVCTCQSRLLTPGNRELVLFCFSFTVEFVCSLDEVHSVWPCRGLTAAPVSLCRREQQGLGAELRHSGMRAWVDLAPRLSSCTARGIFPDRGSNPGPLHWQADS